MVSHFYNDKNHPKIRIHQKAITHKIEGFLVNRYDTP